MVSTRKTFYDRLRAKKDQISTNVTFSWPGQLSFLTSHFTHICDFPVDSALRSALISWKLGRCSTLSGIASFSQDSVKHRAAEYEKSLFVRESRRRSSVLLGRERRFARQMLGNSVLNPRWRSFTSAPARFPRLRVLKCLTSATAPPTTMSSKTSE